MKTVIKIIVIVGVIALLWFIVVPKIMGNKNDNGAAQPNAMAGGAPQAMPVSTVTIAKEPTQIWKSYSAQLSPTQSAEIRPRVNGTITDIRFDDGQNVKKGQTLFVIDPRGFEASLSEANATLVSVQKEADLARIEFERAEKLIISNAISKRVYTDRQNALEIAKARVDVAKAAVKQAQLSIDYAYVKAPFSGQIGRAEVKEGNLVGNGEPVLTTLIANDTIYADFEMDEQTYLSFIRTQKSTRDIPVRLKIQGDTQYYKGVIDSFDNQINATSGTIRGRAILDNQDGALLSGMFANIEIGSAATTDVIMLTERAIVTNQNQKLVFVVGDDRTAQPRPVEIGDSINGQRIITSGLNEGDMVISEGLIKIQPGAPVIPKSEMPAMPSPDEQPQR